MPSVNLTIAHFVKPIPVLQKLTQLLDKVPAGVGTPPLTILTRHYALFDYNPPLTICINRRYIYFQFTPPSAIHKKNGRTLWLQQTRGRLVLTIPPYMESSYLLASDTLTKWLATPQQVRSYSWWWCKNCIVFSDRTQSAPLLIHDPSPRASSQAVRDGDKQFCHCYFPCALHSDERGCINDTNYHYTIISPHTCS